MRGQSMPVNEALSRIFIMLHITEHTGRGVPIITGKYGRNAIDIQENSIQVTIPFDRLGKEVYVRDRESNAPVNAPVIAASTTKTDVILAICNTPKSIGEIAEILGYKDKHSVRKLLDPLIEKGRITMTVPESNECEL